MTQREHYQCEQCGDAVHPDDAYTESIDCGPLGMNTLAFCEGCTDD